MTTLGTLTFVALILWLAAMGGDDDDSSPA